MINSKFTYKRGEEVVLDEELVTVMSWVNQSQLGLELNTLNDRIQGQEVWPSRLAADLSERLKKPVSATEAYLIAVAAVKRMEDFEKGFFSGLQ